METILALGGRRTSPPRNDARQPRLVRFDQWTIVLGSIISLLGFLSQARAATSVTLAWDPSGASGVAGYRLHYGTSSRSYSQTSDLGNTTTTTVSNLLPWQTYYFVLPTTLTTLNGQLPVQPTSWAMVRQASLCSTQSPASATSGFLTTVPTLTLPFFLPPRLSGTSLSIRRSLLLLAVFAAPNHVSTRHRR
jgi:Fibronectin type III domain